MSDTPTTQRPLQYGIVGEVLDDVVRNVPQDEPPALPPNDRLDVIGKRTPRLDAKLEPAVARGARAVRVLTYLTHSTGLPCDTPVARVTVGSGGRDREVGELVTGRDTAEWAARRPDVARAITCPPPAPHFSWVPADGRYLGSTYAARYAWSERFDADALRVERDPRLPAAVGVAVFFVGVER